MNLKVSGTITNIKVRCLFLDKLKRPHTKKNILILPQSILLIRCFKTTILCSLRLKGVSVNKAYASKLSIWKAKEVLWRSKFKC